MSSEAAVQALAVVCNLFSWTPSAALLAGVDSLARFRMTISSCVKVRSTSPIEHAIPYRGAYVSGLDAYLVHARVRFQESILADLSALE